MKPTEAETWLTGQFLNVLIDVLLMPVIKITISGVFVVYFLKDHFEKYSNIMMNRIREGYPDCIGGTALDCIIRSLVETH